MKKRSDKPSIGKTEKRPRKKNEQAARLNAAVEVRALAAMVPPDAFQFSGRGSRFSRAAKLRARMFAFRDIYNAAWLVRYYQHGSELAQQQAIDNFCAALLHELENTTDREALLYAVADSITCSPHGLPWEN